MAIYRLYLLIFLLLSLPVGLLAQADPQLMVSPKKGLYHHPVSIEIMGLLPGQKISLRVKALDAEDNHWESEASFVADSEGKVDPSKQMALEGSYTGTDAMGLFWSMKSKDDHQIATGKGFYCSIEVVSEKEILASEVIYRQSTRELEALGIELIQIRDEFVADLYLPKSEAPLAAIIYLGGSGGGFRSERSSLFASEGYAVLNLKYFKHDGLPEGINEIPLEYIKGAYDWLAARADIKTDCIGLMGRSMGSMLALQYASYFDGLAYVVAEAPSSLVWFGWEDEKSSITYQGKGFAYAEYDAAESERIEKEMQEQGLQYRDGPKFLSTFTNKKMVSEASIPIENMQCPVLFVSGADDQVWPGSMMSEMMMERLKENEFAYPFEHLDYPDAGHCFAGGGQGCGIPYLPPEDYSNSSAKGGTDQGNARAAADSWNAILAFIQDKS